MTLGGQILLDLVVPPIGAAVLWVLGTGWSTTVYGGTLPDSAKKLRKLLTWGVFLFLLVAGFGITLYSRLTGWRYHP